jgi:hypothetical protein
MLFSHAAFLLSFCLGACIGHVTTHANIGGVDAIATETAPKRNLIGRCNGSVNRLTLINAETDAVVQELVNNAVIVSAKPSFSIVATVTGSNFRSVQFGHNNVTRFNVEDTAAYAMCRNDKLDYFQCNVLAYGTHTVTVTPFSRPGARESPCSSVTVTFTIVSPTSYQESDIAPNESADQGPNESADQGSDESSSQSADQGSDKSSQVAD